MKKITSFTHHVTGEGSRISYTYSEIDDHGKMLRSNERENFIVLDPELQKNIDAIDAHITDNHLEE